MLFLIYSNKYGVVSKSQINGGRQQLYNCIKERVMNMNLVIRDIFTQRMRFQNSLAI